MREGGVQKPNGLGMQHSPPTPKVPVGYGGDVPDRFVQEVMRHEETKRELQAANDLITEYRKTAEELWRSLWTMGQWYRETGAVDENMVEIALLPLIDHDELADAHVAGQPLTLSCPECASGKHPNCTHEVLDDRDEMVACACEKAGHPA